MDASVEELSEFFDTVLPHLNEVQSRVVAGALAVALGRGGKTRVAEASGMSRKLGARTNSEVELIRSNHLNHLFSSKTFYTFLLDPSKE